MKKVKTKELVKALEAVKPGLATNAIIEQTDCFVFLGESVSTYNDEITITCPMKTGISVSVPATELLSFVKEVKDEEVDLIIGDKLIIQGEKFTAEFMAMPPDLPIDSIEGKGKWEKLPSDFKESLNSVLSTCSTNGSDGVLTGIHINGQVVESCDNFRVTRVKLKNNPIPELILPAKSAKELLKYNLQGEYKVTNEWIRFKVQNDAVFTCRLYEGEFPDVDPILAFKKDSYLFQLPKELGEVLRRANALVKEKDLFQERTASILVDNDKLIVKSQTDKGSFTERVKYESKIELKNPFSFVVNVEFFSSILSKLNEVIISPDKEKAKFEIDNMIYVIALANI